MIKFVCKDLFLYVYGKQIDNLRTNHRVSASHPLHLTSCSVPTAAGSPARRTPRNRGI